MTHEGIAASDHLTSSRMKTVRRSRTKPEDVVARILRQFRVGYRRNVRSLPGSPDFANKSGRWAIFVNGCFWHHHSNCARATMPKTNTSFWKQKFVQNRSRDARKIKALRAMGFEVVLIWECQTCPGSDTYETD
jgi:DNA mismatch endonuclease (patch repair protein)